jgi:predicted amidohydrolase
MRIGLAQINPAVGDLPGNAARILAAAHDAAAQGADLLVMPELALTGYPPEDLLLRGHFLDDCASRLSDLAAQTPLPLLVVAVPAPPVPPVPPVPALPPALPSVSPLASKPVPPVPP